MEEELVKFVEVCSDPYRFLGELRNSGRKIIGCVPMHVPEEIIHASGMLPVVMWESRKRIGVGHAHIQNYFCGQVRAIVDDAVSRRLGFLDGIVLADSCLAVRGIESVLRRNFPLPYYESLYLPPILNRPLSREYLVNRLQRFKTGLESFAGRRISEDSLRQSVELYEKDRSLIRQVYQLRRTRPAGISGEEMAAVVMSSTIMPKEDHIKLLQSLLPRLAKRMKTDRKAVRVVLSGCLCQAPRFEFLRLCEEAGAVIADDDLYIGSRYFITGSESNSNPLETMATRYLDPIPPCPTRIQPNRDWGDYLVQMVRNCAAQGVIHLMVKHCEPHEIYYPHLKRKLSDGGIPELLLEVDHDMAAMAPIKTRLQAFIEMVGGL